jgi:ankyrin repeat protein/V8-like Glu-specific endopeptidase
MNSTESPDFTRKVQLSLNTHQQNKALYGDGDQRMNLDQLESTKLEKPFIAKVKKQAESIACLVHKDYLVEKGDGWQFHPMTPTLGQRMERVFQKENVLFGEEEAFKYELAPGFGTAFLIGKRLVLTAAHCVCDKDSNSLNLKVIEQARLVFGFHEFKADSNEYYFSQHQVYQIKKVIGHQYTRIRDKNDNFTDWTDWALLELDKDAPFVPLRMNMTEKVADKIELYMLGHPSGLPFKFTGGGFVQGNSHKDFFECDLDTFGGNSGSFVAAKSTQIGSGMLSSGGSDYEVTDNCKRTGERRIHACHITKKQIVQNRPGDRYENCQRVDTLRFLVSPELLGLEGIEPSQNAPEQIVQSLKANYRSKNTIPRLLHSALSIEEIYTELVLLDQNKQDKKEKKPTFEEHRIHSLEDLHGSKNIELSKLFDGAKRLLILGRAGIGKSILCQHMAYQWAHGNMWPGKFDALFWIPLRKLQQAHAAETTASFLFRTCCQEHGSTLYSKDIADYLQQNKDRILFILDGLDEAPFEEGSLQKTIIDELLSHPHWLLTSRPHAASEIQADTTIENVGFASKTIDVYIKKSFPTHAQTISQKISQNPIIFGLCHIPIQLELVCSILQNSKGTIASISSITKLYEELILALQRRFLEKIGKTSAWHWQPRDIEKDSELGLIFKMLESIAWKGIRAKALSFSFQRGVMQELYCNSYPSTESEKRESLFKNICTSGFLQSTGDNGEFLENEYSFLHLTFQEFFAARYLARLLQHNPKEAAKKIQEVKSNPQFQFTLAFLAGLIHLQSVDVDQIHGFFDVLYEDSESMPLPHLLELTLRCLNECEGFFDPLPALDSLIQKNPQILDTHLSNGYSPLISAALRNQNQALYWLTERYPLLLNKQENWSENKVFKITPFWICAANGNLEALAWLYKKNPDFISKFTDDGVTPLHAAALYGHIEAMQFLLEKDPLLISKFRNDGDTPLHPAAYGGHVEAMQFLLHQDPLLISKFTDDDRTPLHAAAFKGHVVAMQFLLHQDPLLISKFSNDGSTPLHYAASGGHVEAMRFLLAIDPLLISKFRNDGSTPLHFAAQNGHVEAMRFLLEIDPDLISKFRNDGSTPLHYAAQNGHVEAGKWLHQQEPKLLHATTNLAKTALTIAKENNRKEFVDWIQSISFGRKLETQSKRVCLII